MTKEQLRMQMLAGIITEGQYKEKIEELTESERPYEQWDGNPFIFNYLSDYFSDRSARKNPDIKYHKNEIIKMIQTDFPDYTLTPGNMSTLDKQLKDKFKYFEKMKNDPGHIKWEKDNEDMIDRYKNNLLPLKTDNGSGRPDSTYYELANTYTTTDRDGNVYTSHQDPKSGYTDYKLRARWINEPVDKETLDKYWDPSFLRQIGYRK